ncbi:hypothetical protein CR513_13652, partial [Mucuna pruriens]
CRLALGRDKSDTSSAELYPTLSQLSANLDIDERDRVGLDSVSLTFTLGKYIDEIVCDVIPMDATHILLVIQDGVTNILSFVHMGQKVTLKPLSLIEVSEDQLKMKIKREKE